MSHLQMKKQGRVSNFHTKKMMFLAFTSLFWQNAFCMGSSLAVFFLINNFWRFLIKLAQRRWVKNSKWKLPTPVEIENHLIPCKLNSKGNNLRQIDLKPFGGGGVGEVCVCVSGGGFWLNNDVVLVIDTAALDICEVQNAVCRVQS